MAINKNFVVKNGLEVNSNLIVADTDATASSPFGGVGIGTSVAPHTLHVNGGIGVTHLLVTGIATFNSNVAVGGAFTATGVGSFGSNVAIDGTLTVQGVNIDGSETSLGDDLVTRHIKATGLSTFVGFSTFQDFVFIQDGLTVTGPATVTGFSTFSDFVHIQDGLNVSGIGTFSSLFIGENQVISSARELQNIDSLDETTRLTIETALEAGPNKFDSLLVTGISTFTGIATFGSGVGIADSIFHLDDTDTAIRFPAIGSFAIDIDGAREVIVTGAGVTIAGIATVTGTLDANGGLEANSAKIEDLTDNRVVIAGSGGELEDDANLTFDGDGLVVGVGLTVAGLSTVTGVGTFFSQVFLGDKLVVAGISTFADTTDSSSKDTGSLIVEGGVGIEKQLFVGAGASVGSGLTVTGDVSIGVPHAPDTKLHVQETINTNYTSAAAAIDANNLFKIENDSDTPDHPFAGMHLRANLTDMFIGVKEESDNLGDLYIVHEGDELVRIVGEGHVGIGTTNPTKHADTNNTAILNVGIVTANTVFAGNVKLDGGNTTIGDDIDTRNLNVSGVSTFIGVSTFAGGVGIADTLYHLGDQDTRIRFPSADTFTIETGGAEEFRVTGAGVSIAGISTVVGFATFFDQVFIGGDNSLVVAGFSTFSNNLDINADIDVDGHTELDNVSVAGFATFTSHVVDIDSDLDVDGHTNLDNVDIAGITTISVSSASTALRITQTGAGDALRVEDSANPDSSPFIITNAGNAGIGTAVPNSKLHVSGGAANGAISITNDTVGNTFTDGLTLISQTGGNAFIAQRENASLTFSTNNTDRVTISSGGDVGIGTTNPTSTNINTHLANDNTKVLAVGIVTAKEYYGDGSKLDNVGGQITVENSGTVVSSSVTSINFSDNLTATAQAGFCTVTASGGGGATEVDTEVSTTDATGVGSFAVFTHQSAAVIAQINQGAGNVQIGRYLIIHDGFVGSASTTATIVEESSVSTSDSQLGSYTVRIEQGNCEMMVNMVSSGIATITTKIDTVTV